MLSSQPPPPRSLSVSLTYFTSRELDSPSSRRATEARNPLFSSPASLRTSCWGSSLDADAEIEKRLVPTAIHASRPHCTAAHSSRVRISLSEYNSALPGLISSPSVSPQYALVFLLPESQILVAARDPSVGFPARILSRPMITRATNERAAPNNPLDRARPISAASWLSRS